MEEFFKRENLERYFKSYSEIVFEVMRFFKIENEKNLIGDHLGILIHNSEEFEAVTKAIIQYSTQIKEIRVDNRRVRVFKLNEPLVGKINIPKLEIFEPKPDIDLTVLKYGIEHISFMMTDFVNTINKFKQTLVIVKQGQVGDSYFAKTEIVNNVEIEFRSDKLGEEEL